MPVGTADPLTWRSLTAPINEVKSPNSFIRTLLFGREEAVPTRDLELSYFRRDRQTAPFVERNGEALMTNGHTEEFLLVRPPHIRTKRAMTPSELLDKRRPGSTIHVQASGINSAMRRYIAQEQSYLMDDILNTEEWMCAMALQGAISYTAQDEAAFTITFPRSASNSITLAGTDLWTDAASSPAKTILDVMQIINDAVSLNVTDVILGSDAADAFIANAEVEQKLDTRRLITGSVDLTNQFLDSGAMFLGTYVHGVRIWRYARQVQQGSSTVDLVRPKFAEFVCATPAAQNMMLYGAIEDMKALGAGRLLQSKRFSKSWEVEDPSARIMLVESNPMPLLKRPDSTASVQVVA